MNAEIALLLEFIDRAFDRKSWHGTNLRGSLRRTTAVEAAWRPGEGRHNAWEIAVHCAYWKYIVWRKLTGVKRGSFPLKGSDWFERPGIALDPGSCWKGDVKMLEQLHIQLRDAVAGMNPKLLRARWPGSTSTRLAMIAGIAAHDLYHAGQIRLLKRLRAKRPLP